MWRFLFGKEYMNQNLVHQLQKHGFSENEIMDVSRLTSPLELPTRHVLINQGEQPTHLYFLLNGLCHSCYLTQNKQHFSKAFYWEQDWIIDFESLISSQPSPFLLESLTPVNLLCLPIEVLRAWREQSNPCYMKLLEMQLISNNMKDKFMLLYSAKERYKLFRQHYPDIETRLADNHIAAYLGISNNRLNKIKAQLK